MANKTEVTADWVRLEIKKATESRLSSPLFWQLVIGVLVPVLGFLFGFCLHLNSRIDDLFFWLLDSFCHFVP